MLIEVCRFKGSRPLSDKLFVKKDTNTTPQKENSWYLQPKDPLYCQHVWTDVRGVTQNNLREWEC